VLTIVDTHDVFSTKEAKVGAFGISEWEVSTEEEARRLARAKVLVAIQAEEAALLSRLAPGCEVLTAGVDFEVVQHDDWPAEPRLLFVGSDNPMNALGLRDFLKEAWPAIRSAVPDARLTIGGRVGRIVTEPSPGIDVLGPVDDLDPYYTRARVVVNPVAAGTGLSIKTVEALSRLRPVVTWPNGLSGLPSELTALVPAARDWLDFGERAIAWLRRSTSAFDASQAATIRRLLAADYVYRDLEDRLARYFDERRPDSQP
jgi:hypothetical protein